MKVPDIVCRYFPLLGRLQVQPCERTLKEHGSQQITTNETLRNAVSILEFGGKKKRRELNISRE